MQCPLRDDAVAFCPPYNVILHDDDDHTYEYVIEMLRAIFGFPIVKGVLHAKEVDTTGRTILLTTHPLDEAEVLCSRIGILSLWKPVAEGSMDELRGLSPAAELPVVELVLALEESFGIEIPDEDTENIKTVKDAIVYIQTHQN